MSTTYYLVSFKTMQKVEVIHRGSGYVRETRDLKVLAYFCLAHANEVVQMMGEAELEGRNLDHGELVEWTDENAESRYKELTGDEPLEY